MTQRNENLKVLIDNDGFITLDQILTILESIDFMYRVLYRYNSNCPIITAWQKTKSSS